MWGEKFYLMKKKTLRTIDQLAQAGWVNKNDIGQLTTITETFSLSVTSDMLQLINPQDAADPIAKQFIPTLAESVITDNEHHDPIGDHVHAPVKGIVHRYPDRCLLMPLQVCPVYCRFCFRRENVSQAKGTLTPKELNDAYQYLKSHPEIWEVILSGGDPLMLKPTALQSIIENINAIPHIDIIRIHTRVPVVDSARINTDMLKALQSSNKTVYVILHANHPREFTPDAIAAINAITKAGIPMLSQTVLLKEVNDDIETLSQLMRCFVKHKIKPYYLHQGDLAKGTGHFRTTIAKGQALMRELRGRFSGLCQPTYVLDIPGGYGKVPIQSCYIHAHPEKQDAYVVEDYQGTFHDYSK
jgi:lysine 2,3-aminomutase